MSYFFNYVGSNRWTLTLDEASGDVLVTDTSLYEKVGNKYAWRLKVKPDGSITFDDGKRTYLSRGGGNTYLDSNGSKMVENELGGPSSERMQKLIAAGKVRAANPALRSALAPTNSVIAAAQASGAVPPIGAAVELNAIQRAAIDRLAKIGIYGDGRLQTAHWTEPGKAFVIETVSATGRSSAHYVVRPDGLLALSAEDESKLGTGLIGRIDPVSGQIAMEWHRGGQLYRNVVTAAEGAPANVLDITYQGQSTRKNGVQWSEISRVGGAPYTREQLDGFAKYIHDDAEMRAHPWGVLSVLPGTLWYCLGDEPDQWMSRRRMYQGQVGYLDESIPQMRFTVATWREPGRVLEITTKFGDGRGWTDVIDLKADGSFGLNSTGLGQHTSLIGHKDKWGQITFPIANYNYDNGIAQNYFEFTASGPTSPTESLVVETNNYPSKSTCTMQAYDAAQLPRLTSELRQMQELRLSQIQSNLNARNEFAADAAAGQQMVANMRAQLVGTILGGGGSGPVAYSPSTPVAGAGQGSNFLQELQSMADTAHREAERSRAQLESTIAQAKAGTSGSGASPSIGGAISSQTSVPNAGATAAAAASAQSQTQARSSPPLTKRTLRALFEVQLVQRDDDDHNPICQSRVMSFTIDWDSNDPNGNFQRENAALDPLIPIFISKCEATRKTFQKADYYVDDGGPFQPKAIRHGDVEVVMP
jgi:hypothetical protein